MRSRISAQSWESVPPAPAWTRDQRIAGVVLTAEQARLLECFEPGLDRFELSGQLGGHLLHRIRPSRPCRRGRRLRLPELAKALQFALGPGMLGRNRGRLVLVVPEAGLLHLVLEPLDLAFQFGQVEVLPEQGQIPPDRGDPGRYGVCVHGLGHRISLTLWDHSPDDRGDRRGPQAQTADPGNLDRDRGLAADDRDEDRCLAPDRLGRTAFRRARVGGQPGRGTGRAGRDPLVDAPSGRRPRLRSRKGRSTYQPASRGP